MDQMVLATQKWLNNTYKNRTGFGSVPENGQTGWDTIYGLTRALQIELGITQTADNFGPGTQSRFSNRWPHGIAKNGNSDNVHGIIQGALWCKGYAAEYGGITTKFTDSVASSITQLKADIGLSDTSSTVDLGIMMVLLSMKQFKLMSDYGGKSYIRSAQQRINRDFRPYTGIIPADGLYGREMNTALIQVLQSLEGFSPDEATGNFGNGTRSRLQTVSGGTSDWVWLASTALACNGFSVLPARAWSNQISSAVSQFQSTYALPKTGVVDATTWMSLLTSKGNPDRFAAGCDCATILSAAQAQSLKKAGYKYVGRYLTGTYTEANIPKAITLDEIKQIGSAGLAVFPIYEDGGYEAEYFAQPHQGLVDAVTAIRAAKRVGFPAGTIIYFAVDFDAFGFQIDELVLPYFRELAATFNSAGENTKHYRVGVYGPRFVCQKVSDAGYAVSSFVADMSTGFSGNLGYAIPQNWAFDQFHEYTLSSSPSFAIDKDAVSGRDQATSRFDEVPYQNEEDLKRENIAALAEIAREQFVKAVLEPLGLWEKFVSIGWAYNKDIEIARFASGEFDVVAKATISETASTLAGETTSFAVTVDNSGGLSAATKNSIATSTAKFDLKSIGDSKNFMDRVTSIAGSVKSGQISYAVAVKSPATVQMQVQANSKNLVPNQNGVDVHLSVTVTFELTVRNSKQKFRLPHLSREAVGVAVGVAALVAVIVFAAEVPAVAPLLPSLMEEFGSIGIAVAAG